MSALAGLLIRAVPEVARAGLANGELRLFGSVIRSATTGQIAYHLQETGAFGRFAAAAMMPGGAQLEAAKIAGQAFGDVALYRQGQQIKAAVDVLAHQQIANLLLSGATLGVSVVGFGIIAARIKTIETQIERLDRGLADLRRSIEALRGERITEDLSLLRTMVQQMDESWSLRDPLAQLDRVASECHVLANTFLDRSMATLNSESLGLEVAAPLLDAFGIAQSTRLSARIACDEFEAASRASRETLEQFETILDCMDAPVRSLLFLKDTAPEDLVSWPEPIGEAFDKPRQIVNSVRERADAVESTDSLVATLRTSGLSGSEFLRAARNEKEVAVLLLPADVRDGAG